MLFHGKTMRPSPRLTLFAKGSGTLELFLRASGHVTWCIAGQFYYLSWKGVYVDQLWLREELLVANFQGEVAFPEGGPKGERRERHHDISF